MSGDHERRLLARARELTDLSDLTDDVLSCLGAARHAGLDPAAVTGLVGCAAALGAAGTPTYAAGDGWTGRHASERDFIGHVASIEDDIEDRLAAAARLTRDTAAALDTARRDLEEAHDQLAGARRQFAAASAIAAANEAIAAAQRLIRECQTRIVICEAIGRALSVLRERLKRALARICAVPGDLGETYQSVYNLIRSGGRMPRQGRWIQGIPA